MTGYGAVGNASVRLDNLHPLSASHRTCLAVDIWLASSGPAGFKNNGWYVYCISSLSVYWLVYSLVGELYSKVICYSGRQPFGATLIYLQVGNTRAATDIQCFVFRLS
jgi:hypothetical protein